MAKKRKRRPTASGRPGGRAGVATATQRGEIAPPPVKPEPAAPGGPNRQARKDEARRQREMIRRRMARRRFLRRGGIVALVVAIIAGVALYVVLKPTAATAAGCTKVQTILPYPNSNLDRAHVTSAGLVKTPPPLATYRSTPPASGPHDPNPLPAGVYASPPDIYRTIHSLEHGTVIVWFDPSIAGSSAVRTIEDFYRQTANNDHVIVAEYNYPTQGQQGKLLDGRKMVLTAWHHRQMCTKASLAVVKGFVAGYRTPTGSIPLGYKGDAPEAGSQI